MSNIGEFVVSAAEELVDIYDDNSRYLADEGERLLTEEGMEMLGERFEQVPLELRAAVFVAFINELDAREIKYDPEQFTQETVQ